MSRRVEIFCPCCRWRPRPGSRWSCRCHHVWNTFDTGGHCPRCGFTWKETQCLSCLAWSPHADWYHEQSGDGGEVERRRELTPAAL